MPTCSTPGSRRRSGRSRRSAGPTDTRDLRAFYPTDVLSTARDIIFLWVARMVMMGIEFMGDVPFATCRPLGDPGAGRAAHVKSLGTGDRPDRRDRGATAPTPCASACWRCRPSQDVRYSAEKVRQGGATWPTSCGTRRGYPAARWTTSRPGAAARDGRGPLDPVAARARHRSRSRGCSTTTSSRAPRSTSTTSSGARCATGTWSSSSRGSTTRTTTATTCRRRCCTCSSACCAAAPADAVRDRGGLVAPARRARAARGRPVAVARPRR